MAAFARTELDLIGLARQDNQAAVQLFVIRDGKLIGRDVFLLDAAREATDDEVLTSFLEQYYTRAGSIPREVYLPSVVAEAGASSRRSWPSVAAGPSTCASRSAARSASSWPSRPATPPRRSPASRPAGWPTRARRWRRWRSSPRRSACPVRRSGSSATTSATSRAASRSAAWSSSRTASRAPASTAGSRSRRSAARTTSPATRRSFAAGSALPGRARRGSRRRAAGRCPTSSSSTAARARSARPRPSSTSSVCTTCRWPASPRSARSCSCPAAREPILLPATSPALYLVQRLRDEAHRFAITYHRDLRAKRSVRSAFDDLPGVGPKRKRELMKVFGSIKRVRDAPVEQIAAVPGIGPSLAARIKATLEA